MVYATREDIEVKYGKDLTTMIADHGLSIVEIAEDEMNDAIANSQPQEVIDAKTLTYTTALANYQTEADATIDQNLDDGAALIDDYLRSRYPRPWAVVPTRLKAINVDLAVYELALAADWRTDEMTTRYERAIKLLESIRDGLVDLDGEMEELEEGETEAINTGGFMIGSWKRK